MDANQKEQDEVQKGFNAGYTLQSRSPELADQFVALISERKDSYSMSFIAGVREKQQEPEKTIAKFKVPERNKKLLKRPMGLSRDSKDRSRDRDDR